MTAKIKTIDEQKKEIQDKREALRRKLLALENKKRGDDRKADTHLKAAIGGAIIKAIQSNTIKVEGALWVLKLADEGLKKEGLARDRYNELLARLTPKKQA